MMRKFQGIALVAALALLGTAASAQEIVVERDRESDKSVGLGYGQSPGGVTGLTLEGYLAHTLMLNAMVGLSTFSPKGGGDTATAFEFAAGMFYRWKNWDNVALMIGGRFDISHASFSRVTTGADSATEFAIEMPLRAEVYFGHMFGVYGEVAAVIDVVGDGGGVTNPGRAKGVYLDFPMSQLLGSFGAVFYFP